jgi:late competence protein required for DNA uptake (superfamily II DNA/RNA helicase)
MTTTITKQDIVDQLRSKGYKTTFKTKQEAQNMLDNIRWYEHFPWHEDQQTILQWNIHDKKESVVQGVFGSGKTTVMMGIFSKLVETHQVSATSVMFCAFNVSIRNELKKKLKLTVLKNYWHLIMNVTKTF